MLPAHMSERMKSKRGRRGRPAKLSIAWPIHWPIPDRLIPSARAKPPPQRVRWRPEKANGLSRRRKIN